MAYESRLGKLQDLITGEFRANTPQNILEELEEKYDQLLLLIREFEGMEQEGAKDDDLNEQHALIMSLFDEIFEIVNSQNL